MKTWVKLYTEITRDPKWLTLDWEQRGIWCAVLAMTGEIDDRDADGVETGALDTVEYTALRIRCDVGLFAKAVAAFTERGMIEERDGILYLPNYVVRQARSPSARPLAARERQQAHRSTPRDENASALIDEGVTRVSRGCHEGVTRVSRGVTRSDSDTDTDTDTEAEVGTFAAPVEGVAETRTAEPSGADAPETPPAPKRRGDPRSKHPAIVAVRAATGAKRYPPLELYGDLIATIGEEPDVGKLQRCREEWVRRGYNPSAWTWATEWYASGIPGARARASPDGALPAAAVEFLRRANGNGHG